MAIADALMYAPDSSNVGPPTPVTPQGPPTPTGLEENKSKWRSFLSTLEDPNVRTAMIMTGLGLMRSPRFGEGTGDVVADALGSGLSTLQGLRNMQYERQQKEQMAKQQQQNVERQLSQGEQRIGLEGRRTTAEEQRTTAEIERGQTETNLRDATLQEQQRHNIAAEETARISAEADRTRARAYGSVGNRTPQDIQKINMLAAQYQTEGMDEVAARARAVMVVESTGAAKTPGEQAQKLYEAKLRNWSADINNFGKSLTPQEMQQMQQESMNEVFKFYQFSQSTTGQPPQPNPQNPRQGVIDRSQGSPVGTVKSGYRKVKAGPDSDKMTWEKVNASGNAR